MLQIKYFPTDTWSLRDLMRSGDGEHSKKKAQIRELSHCPSCPVKWNKLWLLSNLSMTTDQVNQTTSRAQSQLQWLLVSQSVRHTCWVRKLFNVFGFVVTFGGPLALPPIHDWIRGWYSMLTKRINVFIWYYSQCPEATFRSSNLIEPYRVSWGCAYSEPSLWSQTTWIDQVLCILCSPRCVADTTKRRCPLATAPEINND